jgi:hypothetical protein
MNKSSSLPNLPPANNTVKYPQLPSHSIGMQVFTAASLVCLSAVAGAKADAVLSVLSNHTESQVLSEKNCMAPEYHVDYPGNDYANAPAASFQDCCRLCDQFRECGAYTWTSFQGGTCWLKSARSRSAWVGANSDGSAHTISAMIFRCAPFVENTDLVGIEGGSQKSDRPEGCCQGCFNYRGCKGFSWSNFEGGTCWFKGGDMSTKYAPGVKSSFFSL